MSLYILSICLLFCILPFQNTHDQGHDVISEDKENSKTFPISVRCTLYLVDKGLVKKEPHPILSPRSQGSESYLCESDCITKFNLMKVAMRRNKKSHRHSGIIAECFRLLLILL